MPDGSPLPREQTMTLGARGCMWLAIRLQRSAPWLSVALIVLAALDTAMTEDGR